MIYQKCSACHSEWKAIKWIGKCPFCGNKFDGDIQNFNNVEDIFRYIIYTNGIEIIKQKNTFLSLFADYAPMLEKERRVIKIALEAGVYTDLMSINKTNVAEQTIAKIKAINKLNHDYLLDQKWSSQAILWFVSQLNWDSQADQSLSNQTMYEAKYLVQDFHQIVKDLFSVKKPASDECTIDSSTQSCDELSVGNKVKFGSYPYEKDGTKRMINWEIIDIKNDTALLWSEMCLDVQPFHRVRKKCSWIDSDIRKWLIDEFTDLAFQPKERDILRNVIIGHSINPKSGRLGGEASSESVFLLSNEEFDLYKLRRCQMRAPATPYAVEQGIYRDANSDSFYWVRTPGSGEDTQMFVGRDGCCDENGNYTDQKGRGVRPAIWVDCSILKQFITS